MPSLHPSDTPLPPSTPPSPTPSAPPVSPTPQGATQETIFRAIGEWIAVNNRAVLTPTVYVLKDISNSDPWRSPEDIPELRGADPPLWGDQMTDASRTALEATIGAIADLEFVDDSESVVDPDGFEHFGCRPYLGDRTMVRLEQPLPVGDRFFVEANLDQGCQGLLYLFQVEQMNSQFEVTRVVREGSWIV